MEYTGENLEKAVILFYKTEAGQQGSAHQWLTEAQHSSQAWDFVWELLNPQRIPEVQFFAATTLHTKLMKHWNEVPEECYEMLKRKLLEAVVSYGAGPKLVLNRLCIALAAYIIHTVPQHWTNAFEDLVASFQPQHLPNVEPERVVWILLEILSVIPEEFQSSILATTQRNRVRAVLQNVSKDILKVVEMCLVPVPGAGFTMSNLTTYVNATKCCSTWVQLGGASIEECFRLVELLVDLIAFVYWNRSEGDTISLEEMDLFEVATEALSSTILHPQTHKYHKLIMRVTATFLQKFLPILDKERQNTDPNKDVLAGIYGLIINTGETYAKLFIEKFDSPIADEQAMCASLLNCVLGCANLPGTYPVDETSSTLTFGFWYSLQDELMSSNVEVCSRTVAIIKAHYLELFVILLNKSMFPSNWEEQATCFWSLDDREMFRCYRQDIADTYLYCFNVLNYDMLELLQQRLDAALHKCVTLGNAYWNEVESCLHAFAAIAENVLWEALYLPKLMETLESIPYRGLHVRVLAIALNVIGSYSEWLGDNPDSLRHVVPLIVASLGTPEVAPNATIALKDVSNNCQKYMETYADHLLGACQTALQSDNLKLGERVRLMYSLGKILSVLPVPRIMDYLNVVLGKSMEEMQVLVNAETSPHVINSLVTKLKILAALFSTLNVRLEPDDKTPREQPVLLIIQNSLPLYNQLSAKYCTNNEIMEVFCMLFKHAVAIMDDYKVLVPDILRLLGDIYARAPHPSILIVTKTVFIMFGGEESLAAYMYEFLHKIVDITLQMCISLNYNNLLAEKTDVLEAFFNMLSQTLKKNPRLIFNGGLDCTAIIQGAILCLALPETKTLKACTSFLSNFIIQSREREQALVIQKCGESLVNRILLNIGGMAHRSTMDNLADVLLSLNKKYCDNLSRWLNSQMQQEHFPSTLVTAEQKSHFIKMILKEKANRRRLAESLTEFTLLCRGILRPDPTSNL